MNIEPDWKIDLQNRCLRAIAQLPNEDVVLGATGQGDLPAVCPSLYSFYEELLAMRNEVRKINRKTAGTFTKFGDVLEAMQLDSGKLREHLNEKSKSKGSASSLPRNTALALVDLLDRAQRLEKASKKQQEKGWRALFRDRDYEDKQNGAISIFTSHLQRLLESSKVEAIPVHPGDRFDPLFMKSVGELVCSIEDAKAEGEDATELIVTSELLPGYRLGDQCLRPSEVSLSRQIKSPK